jgi:site-specific DNA-methyltransferase (adenine-specific)
MGIRKERMREIETVFGDCLIVSNKIPDESVDLILSDVPYGIMKDSPSTWNKNNTKWDTAISPKKIFAIANRVLRKKGKLILFSQEPYTNKLITSAIADIPFSYRAIWEKNSFANNLGAKRNMVSFFEDILVFSKHLESERNDDNPCKDYSEKLFAYINKPLTFFNTYYGNSKLVHFYTKGKQFRLCTESMYNSLIDDFNIKNMEGFISYKKLKRLDEIYKGRFKSIFNLWEGGKYKSNILKYKKDSISFHPTQKPVMLMEDLIKTFSNVGDVVVDLTCGSGSTLVGCKNTGRDGIGIDNGYCEKDKIVNGIQLKGLKWVEIAQLRLDKVL